MRFPYGAVLFFVAIGVFAAAVLIPPWTPPWQVSTTQVGPDASSMGLYLNDEKLSNRPQQPEFQPAGLMQNASAGGMTYTNLQVLNGESPAEIDRTMQALTAWVSPDEGCGFCHGGQSGPDADYAADYPRKEVARQMLRMTRDVNASWTNHVGSRGVTCFTCHQGKTIPQNVWHKDGKTHPPMGGQLGNPEPWHTKADTIRNFFPNKPYEMFLLEGMPANRVQTRSALVDGTAAPQNDIMYAENLYILMMQMSQGIGANCTLCHNSRAAFDWNQSPPERLHGYSGMKMALDLNRRYLAPLDAIALPEARGPQGDAAKANCGTCHNQRLIPAGGMKDVYYPALVGPLSPGPTNQVAADNPHIPQLSRKPVVGQQQGAAAGMQ